MVNQFKPIKTFPLSIRKWIVGLSLLLFSSFLFPSQSQAVAVLMYYSSADAYNNATEVNLYNLLAAIPGYTVTRIFVNNAMPVYNPTGDAWNTYDQVWDVRFASDNSTACGGTNWDSFDTNWQAMATTYVGQQCGNLYLLGENPGFNSRNYGVGQFLVSSGAVGAAFTGCLASPNGNDYYDSQIVFATTAAAQAMLPGAPVSIVDYAMGGIPISLLNGTAFMQWSTWSSINDGITRAVAAGWSGAAQMTSFSGCNVGKLSMVWDQSMWEYGYQGGDPTEQAITDTYFTGVAKWFGTKSCSCVTNTFTPTPTNTFTSTPTPTFTNTFTPTYTSTFTNTFTNTYTSTYTPTFTNTFTNTATNTATHTVTNTVTSTVTNTSTATVTNSPTNTVTATATNTTTHTATNTVTQTLTNTATNTSTQTATNTQTNTFTNTMTNTATNTLANTATFTNTATNTATHTATNTVTATVTNTTTNTVTATATNTTTHTATNTATATVTNSPTNTATNTATFTMTNTATNTLANTGTFTNTATNTVTSTTTNTPTHTATNTSTNTLTNTFTNTATNTATNTLMNTATFTNTATNTATQTVTNSVTSTATNTLTSTFTNTATNTATNTLMNTGTFTNTVTNTATQTVTNSATNTATSTMTSTFTNTYTSTFTNTPTDTAVDTATFTNTPTDTATLTMTNTPTNTPTTTDTFTVTYTNTPTNTSTDTSVNTPTDTATSTFTSTFTATATNTWTSTATWTFTNTFTSTNSDTATNTTTSTPTPTNTFTATATSTFTNTFTNTNTSTPTNTFTNTSTFTTTFTNTATNTATKTFTSTFTNTATNTATPTFTATFTFTPTPTTGLGISKNVSKNLANSGDVLTYSIAVTVMGNSATGLVVTDTLPAGVTFSGFSSTNPVVGTFTASTDLLSWTMPSPLAIGTYLLSYQTKINDFVPAHSVILNKAGLSQGGVPLPLNSTAPVTVIGTYTVKVNVYNSSGEVVKSILIEAFTEPVSSITLSTTNTITTLNGPGSSIEILFDGYLIGTWDGTNNAGLPVSNGSYSIHVDNMGASGVVTSVSQNAVVNRSLANISASVYNTAGEEVRSLYSMVNDPVGSSMTNVTLSTNVIKPGISSVSSGAASISGIDINEAHIYIQTSGTPVTLIWDGTTNQGNVVTPGVYTIQVHWDNGSGQTSDISRELIVLPGYAVGGIAVARPNVLNAANGMTTTFDARNVQNAYSIRVQVYTLTGQLVQTLTSPSGDPEVPWNAGGMASGIYIAVVEVDNVNGGVVNRQRLKVLLIH
jgi:hypothetical protein